VIAERAGVSADEGKALLESLADKGLVYAREKDGQWGYALLPIMPGIFEFPYMKGPKDDKLKRLAGLWEEYLMSHAQHISDTGTPFARVIAIQEEVENEPRVLTFEKVYELIEEAKVVGLSICACRNAFEHCDAPLEACMLFDDTCTYLVERGFGRYITKDEMKEKLREFDEAGLVHQVNNAQDKLTLICNCCPCCCHLLRSLTEFGNPSVLTTSGFTPEVDAELCDACEICVVERCPMGAMELVEGLARANDAKCIGCGLCVTGCPQSALRLVRREGVPAPAPTSRDMGMKILTDKGKLDDFIKLNMG